MAVCYSQRGVKIPSVGCIIIARVDSGVEVFDVPGLVSVTMRFFDEPCSSIN